MTSDRAFLALRALLSALFLYYGLRKVLGGVADVAVYDAIGFGQWPRPITGSVEVIAAILLWLPGAQVFGALLIAATMIVGGSALILFTDLFWGHLALYLVLALALAWHHRAQLPLTALR